ncbi:MAG: hypothetical protein ACRES0_09485, partial [Pseudomonas sp.]
KLPRFDLAARLPGFPTSARRRTFRVRCCYGWLCCFASSMWEAGQFQSWHGINYLLARTYRMKPGVVDGEDPELLKSGQAR